MSVVSCCLEVLASTGSWSQAASSQMPAGVWEGDDQGAASAPTHASVQRASVRGAEAVTVFLSTKGCCIAVLVRPQETSYNSIWTPFFEQFCGLQRPLDLQVRVMGPSVCSKQSLPKEGWLTEAFCAPH